MHWIAPSEKDMATGFLEKRLWDAAEHAGPAPISGLKSQEYSGCRPPGPVLSRIYLRFAELARPVMRQRLPLIEPNRDLRRTRDLLLPRLLSGRTAL